MHSRGQHIARCQRVFHHVRVQRLGFAARKKVKPVQSPVGRVDQRAGAAGVVGDAEVFDTVRVVPAAVVRYGQVGQERSRLRPRVEGSQKLAVGDEPLEYGPGEIVGL